MKFDLSDQQREFQDSIGSFLRDACPITRALEAFEKDEADLEIWRGLMELGVGAVCVPEEHDGLGLGLLDLAVIAETIGRYAVPGPFFEHALATLAICFGGSDQQKSEYLPRLAMGELRATIAFANEKGGWTADVWDGEPADSLTINRQFVPHAEGADLVLVGLKDGNLAIVQGDDAGLSLTQVPSTDGGKKLFHASFDNVKADVLESPVGQRILDAGLVLLAADAFGGASQSLSMSVEYAKERKQFGKPIGEFQGMKHQLSEMAVAVEPSIGLYWYAAYAFDSNSDDCAESAALAKSHITQVFANTTRKMIEAHGGIGYTWEFGAHIWLKRALFNQSYLGSPRIHRARIAQMAGW